MVCLAHRLCQSVQPRVWNEGIKSCGLCCVLVLVQIFPGLTNVNSYNIKMAHTTAHLSLMQNHSSGDRLALGILFLFPTCWDLGHTTQQQVLPLSSFYTLWPLQSFPLSPLFIRHTHAQTPTLQLQNSWLAHFSPHIWNNHPQDIRHTVLARYSLFLQKQTQDISLPRIFQLHNIILHPW